MSFTRKTLSLLDRGLTAFFKAATRPTAEEKLEALLALVTQTARIGTLSTWHKIAELRAEGCLAPDILKRLRRRTAKAAPITRARVEVLARLSDGDAAVAAGDMSGMNTALGYFLAQRQAGSLDAIQIFAGAAALAFAVRDNYAREYEVKLLEHLARHFEGSPARGIAPEADVFNQLAPAVACYTAAARAYPVFGYTIHAGEMAARAETCALKNGRPLTGFVSAEMYRVKRDAGRIKRRR